MQFCSMGKSTIEARVVSDIVIQSALSKMDTFGTGTKCLSYKKSSKGNKQWQGPTLGIHIYRGVRLIEVSVKRESTI